jgi:hypothetical protein
MHGATIKITARLCKVKTGKEFSLHLIMDLGFFSDCIAPVILKFPPGKHSSVFTEQKALREERNLFFHWQSNPDFSITHFAP